MGLQSTQHRVRRAQYDVREHEKAFDQIQDRILFLKRDTAVSTKARSTQFGKGYVSILNLWLAPWSTRNSLKVKLPDYFVVSCKFALTLECPDCHRYEMWSLGRLDHIDMNDDWICRGKTFTKKKKHFGCHSDNECLLAHKWKNLL